MEDFCDRIPGQHTGRLSLEHQASEAAEWQRKVDDLQKQLDSANRIIQIKDETISLLEKRCNNLREELDELSDRVAVLHERIIDQNNAMRNSVKASPAAEESPAVTKVTENGIPLPPCPKCGGEPMLRRNDTSFMRWSWVQCTACGSRTFVSGSDWQAIQEWKRGDLDTHAIVDVPAAGESSPISPEVTQAHGLTPPATPSAAVGASEPGAVHTEWCDGAKEFCERQVESDTVPRAEYDRVVKLNHHLREVCVMAIVERVPSDSKPTNCHNPESEDTRFPDPSPPAESPDDWVTQDRVPARPGIDQRAYEYPATEIDRWDDAGCINWDRMPMHGDQTPSGDVVHLRCRRKDLPPVVPKTRTVTLREYQSLGVSHWTTATTMTAQSTGRTAVVEVPE